MGRTWYRPARESRGALVWMGLFFGIAQLALGLLLARRHPEVWDPVFRCRLEALQARLAESSGRPLVLVLGSSRPANGICPDVLAAGGPTTGQEPLVFNFAVPGGGPVRELMILRRLLARGVRPDWVLAEVWAPFMSQRGYVGEEGQLLRNELYWPDLAVIGRLYGQWWEPLVQVAERALTPSFYYRTGLVHRYARFLLPKEDWLLYTQPDIRWASLDGFGWLPHPGDRPDAEDCRREVANGKYVWQSSTQDFRISEVTDGATRGLLELCQQHGIKVAFFLMPEPSTVRAWYDPALAATFHDYLERLREQYGVALIDARDWSPDEDFTDMFHLLPDGARTFSLRFGRDALWPLLAGRPTAPEVQDCSSTER